MQYFNGNSDNHIYVHELVLLLQDILQHYSNFGYDVSNLFSLLCGMLLCGMINCQNKILKERQAKREENAPLHPLKEILVVDMSLSATI